MNIDINNIKTIVFDMDGTILTDDKEIDRELAKITGNLKDRGINFVLATGRMKEMVYLFSDQLGLNDSIIACCNGADIGYKEFKTRKKDIFVSYFPLEISHILLKEAKKLNLLTHIFSTRGMLSDVSSKRLIRYINNNERLEEQFKTPVCIGEQYFKDEYLTHAIKFFVDGDSLEQVETFIENINKYDMGLEIVYCGDMAIDINMPGITKGNALKILNKKKIIDLDTTMAFGDNFNDIPMFKNVKYPISMGNAKQETKQAAIDCCDSNNNYGVGKYLKKLFNL